MAVRLNSYVSFDGNAREAMEFYKTVFGGDLYMDTFASFASDEMPVAEEDKGKIMHAYLKAENGIELMAADTPTGVAYRDGARITLTLNGDDEPLLRSYWDKLADDGVITMPLGAAPWGDTFGMVTDRYGIAWMVDIGSEQEGAQ